MSLRIFAQLFLKKLLIYGKWCHCNIGVYLIISIAFLLFLKSKHVHTFEIKSCTISYPQNTNNNNSKILSLFGNISSHYYCMIESLLHCVCILAFLTHSFSREGQQRREGGVEQNIMGIAQAANN